MDENPARSDLNAIRDLADPLPGRPIAWKWLGLTIGLLALAYLSMLNPYWVPSGDGDMYTCVARSLARGQGLIFNGARAAIEPPGWPLVLSLMMRISPQFIFLKLVQITCMLASMGVAFLIVRRFVSDRMSAGVILLTGTLSVLYPLTFWMHTEAFFCLLGFGAMLIAFRIRDGVARPWEAVLMLALVGYAAFTRWSGVLYLGILIPILLSNTRHVASLGAPKILPANWKHLAGIAGATFVIAVGTFAGTHRALRLTTQEKEIAITAGVAPSDDNADAGAPSQEASPNPQEQTDDAKTPELDTFKTHRTRLGEVIYRISTAGKWFAWLLWQPTRFGQSVGIINVAGMIAGWLTIVLLVVATLVRTLRHRDYFWLGLAAYTGGLCLLWPNPNARYFVPVAPFIILGVYLGIRAVRDFGLDTAKSGGKPIESARLLARRSATPMAAAFTVATIGSNLPLMAIDVCVFRSSDFYAAYEAGANKELLVVASMINAQPFDGRIGTSERYDNMGRSRISPFAKRALHLLCDREVLGAPRKESSRPTSDDVRKWARRNNCVYYVYQQPWWPWRVWHFRLSPSLQAKLLKRSPVTTKAATTASATSKPSKTSTAATAPTTAAAATTRAIVWAATAPLATTTHAATRPITPGTSGGWELWGRYNAQYVQIPLTDINGAAKPAAYPTRVPGL